MEFFEVVIDSDKIKDDIKAKSKWRMFNRKAWNVESNKTTWTKIGETDETEKCRLVFSFSFFKKTY